jgi:sugar phosphate isomerase/epimerase
LHLQVLRSLWTNGYDLSAALADCRSGRYDGVEGPVPCGQAPEREFRARLRDEGHDLPFVSEIVTGGGYVPTSRDPEAHLRDLLAGLERGAHVGAVHHTVLFGCDCWPLSERIATLERALDAISALDAPVSFETHRSRVTYSPWDTAALLRELPALRLTCDFSHWCVVAERLVLDEDEDLLALCAERADHVHARIGYEQGPQVPHPGARAYAAALNAHERWWRRIVDARAASGREHTTFTCEFGPDGYQQAEPFTDVVPATLDELNGWMADRLRAALPAASGVSRARGPTPARPARAG